MIPDWANCFAASILLNNGDGTFRDNGEFGQGYTPGGIDAGDLDGDGDRDVVYGNGTSTVTILRNDGTGTFQFVASVTTGDNPQDVAIADFDGDGDLDVVTSNNYGHFVSMLRNAGTGSFSPVANYIPGDGTERMAVADYDGDGDLDMVVANRDHDHVSIIHNQGNGSFADRRDEPSGNGPEDVAVGDLDGDSLPDVAVTHWDDSRVAIFMNTTIVSPDADGDGVRDSADCAPANGSAWFLPSAVDDLLLDGAAVTRLSWSASDRPGSPVPRYDVLRGENPADFSGATCLEAGEIDRVAFDTESPDELFVYLVRATNACGAAADTPQNAASCP